MKPWLKWILAALVLALVLAGALRALSARTAQKEALALQQEAQRVPAQIELSAGDLVPVRMTDLPRVLAISGPVKAVNSAFVKARVAGELQDLKVREGDYVKVGEVIAKVDTTEYQARTRQAQQQAQAAKAQVDIAKRNFDNNQALVSKGFISSTALESSAATLAAAQASFSAAQAGADVALKALDDTVLRAPIAGVVSQRLVQPGERVAVDARVVEIVDLARLEVEASLSASDSFLVKVGQAARLTVEGSDKPVMARLVRINPSAVAGSRAILIYLAIDSSTGLRQGFFAQGTLQTDVLRTLAVPLGAVRSDKPVPYVQLLIQGKVVHQEVRLGQRGEIDGVGWVAIQGVPENTTALAGTVGSLRNDTPVKLANGAK